MAYYAQPSNDSALILRDSAETLSTTSTGAARSPFSQAESRGLLISGIPSKESKSHRFLSEPWARSRRFKATAV